MGDKPYGPTRPLPSPALAVAHTEGTEQFRQQRARGWVEIILQSDTPETQKAARFHSFSPFPLWLSYKSLQSRPLECVIIGPSLGGKRLVWAFCLSHIWNYSNTVRLAKPDETRASSSTLQHGQGWMASFWMGFWASTSPTISEYEVPHLWLL